MSRADTRGEIVSGAIWMLAFKLTERSLGFLSTIVLVRLLLPDDFGVMAMSMSLIAVLELLKSFSFDVALIQRREVDRGHLDTAWTFNLLFGIGVALMIVALARPASLYYAEPRLEAVAYVLATGWMISSFENVGTVSFRRDMQFRTEYWFLVTKKIATVAVTLPLAYVLRSYWALVAGVVLGRVLSVLISYRMHDFRPRLSLQKARDLMSFSSWLLVNNILYFVNERFTDFAVGRIAGTSSLGLYNISFEIANMPTAEIAAPINRAMLPGYSKIAREQGDLARTYVDAVSVMGFFSLPVGAGIAALAGPLVSLVLGTKWLAAIPLIQVLGIYGALASVGTNTGSALLALGRQRSLTALAALRLCLLVPAVIWATNRHGVLGTAWAVLIVTLVVTPLNFGALLPRLGVRVSSFLGALWRPLVTSVVMFMIVGALLEQLSAAGVASPLAQLLLGTAAGTAVSLALLGLLWWASGRPKGAETIILGQVINRWAARRKAAALAAAARAD